MKQSKYSRAYCVPASVGSKFVRSRFCCVAIVENAFPPPEFVTHFGFHIPQLQARTLLLQWDNNLYGQLVRRIRVFFICQEEILYQPVHSTPDVRLRIQWRRQELLTRTRCCSGQFQGSITLAIETIIVGSYFQFCIDVVVLKSDVCKIFDLTVTKLYRWLSNCAPIKIQ